jgi:pyruvate carboxylase
VLTPGRKFSFPKSVVEMMQGAIGIPEGGWPKVLQRIILDSAGVEPLRGRPGARLAKADFVAARKEVVRLLSRDPTEGEVLSHLLYPQVFEEYAAHCEKYDDTSVLPTPPFFYGLSSGEEISVEMETGKTLVVRYLTTSELHDDGTRTVFFELNGQPRDVNVTDRAIEAPKSKSPKADADDPNHVGAPMPGKVASIAVKKGQPVKAGERLLSIEAMKMETAVYSPRDATVDQVLVRAGQVVAARDLLVTLE